jgi:predicted PurR-regulated permease PerM
VVLLLVLFISALFLAMIRQFLMALFLAGIFSALTHPVYRRLNHRLGGRRTLASAITVLLLVTLVLLPLLGLLGMLAAQAVEVGQVVTPWIQRQVSSPTALSDVLAHIPFYEHLEPHKAVILKKAGETVGTVSSFLLNRISSATKMTVNFLFLVAILLYAMFFFLMDGNKLLEKILYYLPLEKEDEDRMLDRFTSVTRATLKGTIVIGVLQGGLAGLAFAAVGIQGALFWGTIMAVLSVIPGVGSALVWVPAAVVLGATGHVIKALGLAAFCAVVVGAVDNLLRPRLVGKDTQMHELLILLGTLGGIFMFGMIGFIIGPIVAALFVTMWEIYGMVFQDVLPSVAPAASKPSPAREDE